MDHVLDEDSQDDMQEDMQEDDFDDVDREELYDRIDRSIVPPARVISQLPKHDIRGWANVSSSCYLDSILFLALWGDNSVSHELLTRSRFKSQIKLALRDLNGPAKSYANPGRDKLRQDISIHTEDVDWSDRSQDPIEFIKLLVGDDQTFCRPMFREGAVQSSNSSSSAVVTYISQDILQPEIPGELDETTGDVTPLGPPTVDPIDPGDELTEENFYHVKCIAGDPPIDVRYYYSLETSDAFFVANEYTGTSKSLRLSLNLNLFGKRWKLVGGVIYGFAHYWTIVVDREGCTWLYDDLLSRSIKRVPISHLIGKTVHWRIALYVSDED